MDRVRTITVGDRDATVREHALTIGGLPVRWVLDDARFADGSRVPDAGLREAGILRRPAHFDDDSDSE